MKTLKYIRRTLEVIFFIYLLTLPLIGKVYFQTIYYLAVGLLLIVFVLMDVYNWDEKRDERFLSKWPQTRKKGFWLNFIGTALGSGFFIIVMVGLGQFFGNGHTPIEVINRMDSVQVRNVTIIVLLFASIIGATSWSANEKKYEKMYRKKQSESHK